MSRFAFVVQHHVVDSPGAIARELVRAGIEPRDVRGFAGDEVPAAIADAAALVVMGGPMGADDEEAYPFLRAELRLIDSALKENVPILGVCLGAQLLARALGGGVVRDAAREIGWFPVARTAGSEKDPLFDGLPDPFVPFHWHADSIVLPPRAVRLARSERAEVQAFRAGAASYGLQFHLESDEAMIAAMLQAFGGELGAQRVDLARVRTETAERIGEQSRLGEIVFRRWVALARQ
jgi:GMP synthase (glutamine-hydrolysing)